MKSRVRELLVALDALAALGVVPAGLLLNGFVNRWGSMTGTACFLDLLNNEVIRLCPEGHVHLTTLGYDLRDWLELGGLDDLVEVQA